ncbi:signal peptidase I [Bifidobacterium sp.]|uniref:signal peptidase I n=1 Tax=Bifidobacterium sp. TaxID=41200 RepID=UPI0039EBF336
MMDEAPRSSDSSGSHSIQRQPEESDDSHVCGDRPAEVTERRHRHLIVRAYLRFRSVLLTVMACIGLCSMLVFIASGLFGLKVMVVKSGSMEPTIGVGSMIVSMPRKAVELKVGDVITVSYGETKRLVTHRIVQSEGCAGEKCTFVLRGDANAAEDPYKVNIDDATWHWLTIPRLGWAVLWVRTWPGLATMAGILTVTFIALFAVPGQRESS